MKTKLIPKLLLHILVIGSLLLVNQPVYAAVADSAQEYCEKTESNSEPAARASCIERIEGQLAECEQDPQPASREACRTNVLTYNEELTGLDQNFGTSAECDGNEANCCNGVAVSIDVECEESDNPILGYLAGIINFLAAGVGLVVTAMIIVGGIQYITAGGVPQKLESARRRIINALIALVTFIFLYAILRWLIPGNIF